MITTFAHFCSILFAKVNIFNETEKVMLKKSYLCKAISVAKFCGIKESALHSLK